MKTAILFALVALVATASHPATADEGLPLPYRSALPMVARDEPPGPSVPFAFVVRDAAASCDTAGGRWAFRGRLYDQEGAPYVFPSGLTILLATLAGPGVTNPHPDVQIAPQGTFEVDLPVTAEGTYVLSFSEVLVPEFHYVVRVPVAGTPAFAYHFGPGCGPVSFP